jgi:glutathione synthase/RimK-type ligase-like ATP-grasp enzyme
LTGKIWLDEKCWSLSEFTGIYARTVDPYSLPERRARRSASPDIHDLKRSVFLNEAFCDWLEVSPARVANRPSAMSSNNSKPYQTQLIRFHGFLIPATLVTNDPLLVQQFREQHHRIVYKSISSVRSIVSEWLPDRAPDLDKLRFLPTQFQALIPGTNIRVHVAGDAAFATEIISDALDYRYAGHDGLSVTMRHITLPTEVEEKCLALNRTLGLVFSGIDLKHTPDDRWFCFEVNTSPGYSYFQEQSGQIIADALVSHLGKE